MWTGKYCEYVKVVGDDLTQNEIVTPTAPAINDLFSGFQLFLQSFNHFSCSYSKTKLRYNGSSVSYLVFGYATTKYAFYKLY